jgi:hypothetical protein
MRFIPRVASFTHGYSRPGFDAITGLSPHWWEDLNVRLRRSVAWALSAAWEDIYVSIWQELSE